jgi:hypothetical protein
MTCGAAHAPPLYPRGPEACAQEAPPYTRAETAERLRTPPTQCAGVGSKPGGGHFERRDFEKSWGHKTGPKQRNKLMITIVLSAAAVGGPRSRRAPRPAVAKICEKVAPYRGTKS